MITVLTEIAAIPLTTMLAVAIAVLIASAVQATSGIGFGLIAAPVLILADPSFVPGAVLLTGLTVTGLAALRELPKIDRGLFISGVSGRVPGAIAGAYLTAMLATSWFGIVFGCLILLAVGVSIATPRVKPKRASVAFAGAVSGLMGTITSVGAPPMAIALQGQPGSELRATMSAFLLVGAVISVAALAVFGRFGVADLARSLVLIPFCLAGYWLSGPLIALNSVERWLRPIVLGICALMSLVLLWRSIGDLG